MLQDPGSVFLLTVVLRRRNTTVVLSTLVRLPDVCEWELIARQILTLPGNCRCAAVVGATSSGPTAGVYGPIGVVGESFAVSTASTVDTETHVLADLCLSVST